MAEHNFPNIHKGRYSTRFAASNEKLYLDLYGAFEKLVWDVPVSQSYIEEIGINYPGDVYDYTFRTSLFVREDYRDVITTALNRANYKGITDHEYFYENCKMNQQSMETALKLYNESSYVSYGPQYTYVNSLNNFIVIENFFGLQFKTKPFEDDNDHIKYYINFQGETVCDSFELSCEHELWDNRNAKHVLLTFTHEQDVVGIGIQVR